MGDMTLEQVKEEIAKLIEEWRVPTEHSVYSWQETIHLLADAILDVGGIGGLLKLRDEGKLAEILDGERGNPYLMGEAGSPWQAYENGKLYESGFYKRLASSGAEEKDDER